MINVLRTIALTSLLLPRIAAAQAKGIVTDRLQTESMSVEYIRPDHPDNLYAPGGRFVKAGWIKRLVSNIDGNDYVKLDPVWPDYPAFGCTQEFTPALLLNDSLETITAMKIGVGIISYKKNDPLHPTLLQALPWQSSTKFKKEGIEINSSQNCSLTDGYAYEFYQKMFLSDKKVEIVYHQELKNTGNKEIKTENFVHPFFNTSYHSRYKIQADGNLENVATVNNVHELRSKENLILVCEAKINKNMYVAISSDRKLTKVIVWHDKDRGCFAVEPFIQIYLKPGESLKWEWIIKCGNSKDIKI